VSGLLASEHEYLGDLARAWAAGVEATVPPPAGLDPAACAHLLANQPALQTLSRFVDPAAIPAAEREQFRVGVEVARRRTTLMLLELERILGPLTDAGCEPVALKGAPLALTVYRRPEDRWFMDLDVLVPLARRDTARQTLARLGYRLARPELAERYYRKHHFHDMLVSNQGVCVEVHWDITLARSAYSHDLAALRAGAETVALGAASLRVPGAADQVLHGVLQSIAGGFGDLRRILDLHLLDRRLDDAQREILARRAVAANLGTGLWLHYRLREDILGPQVPRAVERHCRPSPSLVRTFRKLDVVPITLGARPWPFEGFTTVLHWLCVPRHLRPREVRRYLLPGEADLLVAGIGVDGPVRPWQWARLSAERVLTLLRMAGRLARATR